MFLREVALFLRTFPSFNLPDLVYFRKKCGSAAGGTFPDGSPGVVKPTFGPVRIAVAIAKDSRAVAAYTCVIRSDLFRLFLAHHAPHGDVVQIA